MLLQNIDYIVQIGNSEIESKSAIMMVFKLEVNNLNRPYISFIQIYNIYGDIT